MSDITLKVRAQALGKSLENLSSKVEEELHQAINNLAHAAYSAIITKIQSMGLNDKSRLDYLNGLKFSNLGHNTYLIHLDGEWANKLESGFPAYGMREILLASQKIVGVGPRTGQPWVRKAKDGHKYASVPFDHHPHRGNKGDLATDLKQLVALNAIGEQQRFNKIFKDVDGNPIDSGSGKNTRPVATIKSVPDGVSKNLIGMAKFQKVQPSGKVHSTYMTWRVISEAGKDWKHPGHRGYHLFQAAEDYVASEMDQIIKTLIK